MTKFNIYHFFCLTISWRPLNFLILQFQMTFVSFGSPLSLQFWMWLYNISPQQNDRCCTLKSYKEKILSAFILKYICIQINFRKQSSLVIPKWFFFPDIKFMENNCGALFRVKFFVQFFFIIRFFNRSSLPLKMNGWPSIPVIQQETTKYWHWNLSITKSF